MTRLAKCEPSRETMMPACANVESCSRNGRVPGSMTTGSSPDARATLAIAVAFSFLRLCSAMSTEQGFQRSPPSPNSDKISARQLAASALRGSREDHSRAIVCSLYLVFARLAGGADVADIKTSREQWGASLVVSTSITISGVLSWFG